MKLKKLLAAAVSVVTLAAAVPLSPVQKLIDEVSLTASARLRGDVVDSGTCGKPSSDNVTWELRKILDENDQNVKVTVNGEIKDAIKLTISGTGDMADYPYNTAIPWYDKKDQITEAEIASGVKNISENVFESCTSLTSINIPSSVENIGAKAFRSCSSLKSVTIPSSVKSLGIDVFIECSALTSAYINSDQITSIPGGLFYNCTSLKSVNIPGSVTSIGNLAFANCTSLSSITVPDSVESIGDGAFYETPFLNNLNSENGIKYIGKVAYASDRDIEFAVIKEGTKSITDNAFSKRPYLTSAVIPDSVKSIGEGAFYDSNDLKTIIFKGNVPPLGTNVFENCSNLTTIYSANTEPVSINSISTTNYTTTTDGSHGTCGKDSAPVYWVLAENGTLPNTTTTAYKLYIFGKGAMADYQNINSLPWNNKKAQITEAEIASGVKSIGNNAFHGCVSLKSITIPDSVTSIGEVAFSNCVLLTSITIPDSVTSIGKSAFADCTLLKSINIGGSVESIGDYAFYKCANLSEVTFKDEKTIKTWGQNLFYIFVNSKDALNPQITKVNFKYKSSTLDKELTGLFPENCTFTYLENDIHSAPAYETYEQNGITYHIYDDYAEVYECDVNAESVEIPSVVEGDSKNVPVTRIGENAFNSCKSLTDVKIPDSVTEIGASAFWGCTSLETIIIPKTVTNIDKNAFSHCTAFETIYGYTGSAAEAFAKTYGYTFKALDAVVTTVTTETAQTTTTTTIITTVTTASTATESGTTAVTTTNLKPAVPTNVAISEDGTVTWDKVDNAVQYKVFKKYGGTAYHSGWVTDNSYRFKSLPREDYEIYVAAKNEYGTSWSKHLQVKVENPLGTVRKINVSNGTVSWNAVQGAVAYKVAKVVNGKTYYGSKTNDANYTFKNVPSKDYKVFVVAFDKDGNRTWGKKLDIKA